MPENLIDSILKNSKNFGNYSDEALLLIKSSTKSFDDVLKLIDEYGDDFISAYKKDGDDAVETFLGYGTETVAEVLSLVRSSISVGKNTTAIARVKDLNNLDNSAKAIAGELSEMCNSGAIRKQTGGMIDSKVVTVAIDETTGEVYFGLSGKNAQGTPLTNPTRQTVISDSVNTRLEAVKESMTGWDLDNCGEYNAINNATLAGADIKNLRVYSKYIYSGSYAVPCENCEALFDDFVKFIGE